VHQFVEQPPLIAHLTGEQADLETIGRQAFAEYKKTLPDEWRVLLDRYAFVDLAFKVVGVAASAPGTSSCCSWDATTATP